MQNYQRRASPYVNTRKQQYTNTGTAQLLDDDLKWCSSNSSDSISNRTKLHRTSLVSNVVKKYDYSWEQKANVQMWLFGR